MRTITLNEYIKTIGPKGNLLALHVQLVVLEDSTGDNLVWDYDLSDPEVALVDSDEKQVQPILEVQGKNANAAFLKQVEPPPVTGDAGSGEKAAYVFSVDLVTGDVTVKKT